MEKGGTDSNEPDDNDAPDNDDPDNGGPDDDGPDSSGPDAGSGSDTDPARKTHSANDTTTAPPPEKPEPDPAPGTDTSGGPDSETSGGPNPDAAAEPTSRGARVWRLLFRGRIRPAGTVPPHRPTTKRHRGRRSSRAAGTGRVPGGHYARAQLITALLTAINANPTLAAGLHPDGHGGHTTPPPGALTYRPSSELAARIRMTYSTCTHPRCDIPSTRCQLDHIVPYNHTDPRHGGWSIEENLHPVCTGHHQLKTAKTFTTAMLTGGAILWTSPAGLRTITLPNLGCPTPPRTRKRARKNTTPEPDLTTDTWWETNMPPHTTPPTLTDLNTAHTDTARTRIRIIRRHFRQHKHIQKLRTQNEQRNEPPPF